MSDKTSIFRPYINPEMAEYEKSQSFRDFMDSLTQPIPAQRFNEIEKRISRSVNVDFYRNNPQGVLESDEIKSTFKSRVFNLNMISSISDEEYDNQFGEDDLFLSGLYLYQDLDIIDENTDFVILDELQINFGDLEIDIYKLLPEGYKVLLSSSEDVNFSEAKFNFKYILVNKDISTLGGLLVLLHEVGHVVNQSHLENESISWGIPEGASENSEDEGEIEYEEYSLYEPATYKKEILFERDASLYALKTIWRELRKNPKNRNDAINFLRYAFASYCHNYLADSAYNNERKDS